MDLILTAQITEKYVVDLYERLTPSSLLYHNLSHTQKVVAHATEIATYYQLDEQTLFIIKAAAWFHDTGHLVAEMAVHEAASVNLMRTFMETQQISDTLIDEISRCIMVTRFPSHPQTLPESIICDADTYHFGTSEFKITDDLVREEFQLRLCRQFPDWYEGALGLLKSHHFFTTYCQKKLDSGKFNNILYIEKKLENRSV
ncbi:HD domain-containing protein [Chitinophaga pinensis]|uniref:HD/PDEase domain-containing protein n=1 Tax=Chitinophaga pinensis (strain ATCC 43595 / DSM 2588 / LMG 13176 / NBRC 15968 / NCIMB 11800 / UQM 2034) TaxID=485918 RepID=A0A979G2Y7_CHIPD|nr:HD domain-containing protein [Chitinophaga pinensis]ACU59905.1 hypothetical protein Cpin_2414 [Chitinophaga pinensis DSM 2588]